MRTATINVKVTIRGLYDLIDDTCVALPTPRIATFD
jgi:hypothetical protein